MAKSKGKADKKDPKKAKDVKKKKEDKKKKDKKKALEPLLEVLPLAPIEDDLLEEEEEEETDVKEPCIQEAAIHMWYQHRVKTKTDSELELEKEMAKQQQFVTDDARTERAGHLRTVHRMVMTTVSHMLQTSLKAVEDGVLDSDRHVRLLCDLFVDDGRYSVVFTYNTNEYHDVDPVTDQVTSFFKKIIIVSDGSDRFEDYVVIVARNRNNFSADAKTVYEEYLFSGFPLGTQSSTVMTGLSFLFTNVVKESINALTNWQQLSGSKAGKRATRYFREDIKDFSNYLEGTKKALDSIVKFTYPSDLMTKYIGSPDAVSETMGDNERINYVESCAESWFDTIESTLTNCEKLFGESGEPLPDTALDNCRSYLAKFCSMLDFMHSEICGKTLNFLKQIKSYLLVRWDNLENRVVVSRITVMDQLKYLNSIRRFWAPLSRCSPSNVANHLYSLLYSFRQIHSSSKIMNSPQRMTAILLKVTNSLLSNCIIYLTNDRKRTIWQQSSKRILEKFEVCLRLHRDWHLSYERMMEDIDDCPDEKQFGSSIVQIFGKFDSFKIRLLKLKDFILKRKKYGVLALSPLEGMEEHTQRFSKIFSIIPGRSYDPLEHRDHNFNEDYNFFLTSIADAEEKLKAFMFSKLAELPNSESLLYMLQRFEKLHLEALDYGKAYANILQMYMYEVEELRDTYNFERSKIISSMFAPPMSARIIWIRGLAQLIRRPMEFFQNKDCLETSPIAQKVIKHYNALLSTFIHYEHVFHHEWLSQFGYIEDLLAQPVLFQMEGSKEKMFINFDERILLTFIEVSCFLTLRLGINELATLYFSLKSQIIQRYTKVQILLNLYKKLKKSVPHLFNNLMLSYMGWVEKIFDPCFSLVTWSSVNFDDYVTSIETTLNGAQAFIKEVNDLREARIEEPLEELSKTMLMYINPGNLSHQEFLKRNLYFQKKISKRIQMISRNVEVASINLINKFVEVTHSSMIDEQDKWCWLNPDKVVIKSGSHIDLSSERHQSEDIRLRNFAGSTRAFKSDCMDVFNYFHEKFLCSLVKAMVYSLLKMRTRTHLSPSKAVKRPMIVCTINLEVPKIVERPTLYEIQTTLNKVVAGALFMTQALTPWGAVGYQSFRDFSIIEYQTYELKDNQVITFIGNPEYENMKGEEGFELPNLAGVEADVDSRGVPIVTYFEAVAQHKEVMRHITALQDIFSVMSTDVEKLSQQYYKFKDLWEEDMAEVVEKFVSLDPLPPKIRERFEYFKDAYLEIQAIPNEIIIGPLQFDLKLLKHTLGVECKAWSDLLGKKFGSLYHYKLKVFTDFINDHLLQLNRPVNDLDDCRLVMQCMEEIRETFVDMNWELNKFDEVFFIFHQFKTNPLPEDVEIADGLRFNYDNLLKTSVSMQELLCLLQKQLKRELLEGIAGFKANVDSYDIEFEEGGPMVPGLSAKEASDRVLLFQDRFEILYRKYEIYSSGERLFGMQVTEYPTLLERKKQFNLLQKLYGLYLIVNKTVDGYFELPWYKINIEVITAEINDFLSRCRKLPKGMKDWPAFIDLNKKLNDFNDSCPLIEMMANKAMKPRHWQRLEKLLNTKFDIDSDDFTLRTVMEAPLLKYKDDVEDICVSAVKEKDIESKLKQVIADWAIVDLQFGVFKNKGEVLIKGAETSEIISMLEDSLMILASLATNRFNAFFKKDIMLWIYNLSTAGEVLENWLIVQNLWIYLEAVFVGGDIAKQLPGEAKRFAMIDKSWMKIMQRARELVNVITVCVGDDTMKTLLPYLLEQLEACQKSLTGYLEQKRLIFPRFFFVSDPALLEILGQASDPRTIQAHLLGVFENIAQVEFLDKEKITKIISREGETIVLEKIVHCIGGVEFWLGALLDSAKHALGLIISQCWEFMHDEDFKVMIMVAKFPSQVGLLGLQMLWTRDSEKAMREAHEEPKIMKKTNRYFLIILNALIDMTAKNLSRFERVRYETLITIHVHQRDIFEELFLKKINSPEDFEWLKQERFNFDEENDRCLVKITDVDFIYQNEFMGCTDRLVITPLTDRCYITLAQSIWMSMGGAPAGPAGTGKTETTKDMGKSLGKYVVVFNCSDQMDFRGLGRIFKGLAQSGSWGCFDEFNRIELPVLSVAAQQISIIFTARREKKTVFIFSDGDTVSLNYEFGFFITMNPGYAGRQELPENLKIMFRSVAMMVPDRHIIIRVKLASCGFRENISLSRKFFILYRLCEEQLSKQVHYDFGLRNILSVLRTLGAQKRSNPKDSEDTVLMRVLRDMNLSKLVDEDEPLFLSLIDDLFVGQKLTTSVYKELQAGIRKACTDFRLTNHPPWNLKVVQLYETSLVRHGLMTMGATGSGKSSCMNVLLSAFTDSGKPHREMRMNPKSITAPQMFGRLDPATNDWTDGIFSTLWRRSLKVKKTDFVWIVLDGPVDAVWIENLNSVLDDNKTLTLANGDRIVMAPNAKLVFEPDNVDNASPATVSRMGMVFLSSSVLDWNPILEAWFLKRKPREIEILRPLFQKIYPEAYTCVETKLIAKMRILEALYIRQCLDILTGLIDVIQTGYEEEEEEDELPMVELSPIHLEKCFLFSMMWSLGSVLELDQRLKLQQFLLEHPSKLAWPIITDESETIFEFFVTSEGEWNHWTKRVEEFMYPTDEVLEYASILVPNVDNVRTLFLIETIAKQGKGVLLIGEQGTAKTVMIKSFLSRYNPELHLSKSLNFSSATTPNMVQRIIESYLDKRIGTTFGPPNNRHMSIFIDDINMPVINEWGDQVTNEIVRQVMEQGGFYSLDKPGEFSTIVDIQFLAAMIHPGGGRNDIPPRLKRQFNVFNCTLPSDRSMDKIFSVIGEGYFCKERFKESIVGAVPLLVPLTRTLWQKTKIKMLPTPAKFHYVFNLRDLSRIWEGILYIQNEEVPGITTLLKLWKHECLRVISDRFTNEEDKVWFDKCLADTVTEVLPVEVSPYFDPIETYFVDFLKEPPEATGDEPEDFAFEAPKIYEEVPAWDFLLEKLEVFMKGYNEVVRGQPMDLVFFKDCVTHLIKVSRVIRTPRGSVMLVGVGGSGKRSITYLASFIALYSTFSITLTRSYNVGNFMEDLKFLYRIAGGKNKGISFIFTDNDIKDEAFLEFLNNILSAGEVANLFAKDEMDELLNEIIPEMRKLQPKRIPTLDNLYDFFISTSRKNLHLVLCFSPVSEKFRSRSLKFPGLISGCTIDWFTRWPREALIAVANHFIFNFPIVCDAPTKLRMIHLMGDVHDDIADRCIQYYDRYRRRTYVTPKSFLSFLQGYKDIYMQKNSEIDVLTIQMTTGLKKLEEAAESVNLLKIELIEKEKEIAVANAKTDVVLTEVRVKTEQAEVVKAEVKEVADKAGELVKVIEKDKVVAENKLELARPALEAAEAALLTITSGDIATVRKLGKPPYLITLIMDCVQLLFQKRMPPIKVDPERNFFVANWEGSLKIMTDTRFLWNLQNFPKDSINGEMIDLLQPYFTYPLYSYANAKQACGNVAGLLAWTIAMQDFYGVNKEVLPLKANLAIQQFKLNGAQKELGEAKAVLKAREDELASVNVLLNNALKEKKAVQDVADKCQARMDAATALLGGLSGEQTRWTEQLFQFKAETERLVGDVLLLTGFLSYMGPFNQEFRTTVQITWVRKLNRLKIPVTDGLNVVESLVDAATIGEWNLDGLPNDDLSIQNGIIVSKAMRFPLLIDPQSQGVVWIKNKERANSLVVTSLNHKYFRQHLEDALSLGIPLLLEDILEDLDPVLDNVLEKNFIKVGTTLKVKLSDKEVDVLKSFRIYITTKLPNPMYTPEVYARTSIIDFTVTIKGLEDQLLGRVILTEKRELENERTALLADVTANKRKMKELEANLLLKLTTVKGSLVDDETVLQVLNVTKDTATSVRLKLKNAATTELKINSAREEFRPVASRGSVLYFLVVEMAMVNYMYQTSLVQFLERFDFSLDMSEKHQVTGRRIIAIIDYLTFEIFRYTCRGLYEKHKYLFTMILALKIDIQMGRITHLEFENLVKGGGSLNLNNVAPKPNFRWLSDTTWLNMVQLSGLPVFSLLLDQLVHNEKNWKNWFEKPAPEEEPFPEDYDRFNVFHKLLLIRAMCPDRILSQSKKYIAYSLGDRYAAPVLLNMPVMLGESRPNTPMICFLSMGSDPTPMIETMAKRREIRLGQVSMGQGQEIHARKLMSSCMAEGGWVLLQNCHLGLDYMTEMFLVLTDPDINADNDFRVWITTEPHPAFPINLLQICIKFTFEPPQGLAAGLMRTYASMTQDFLDFSNDPHYLPLVYGISFLHSVVQERRKFGPLGWNIPYEFNFADWYASTLFVQNHLEALEKGQPVSWVTLKYMISEVQYGGRVTDDFDKRLLVTLTRVWFNEQFMLPDFMFYRGYKVMKFRYLQQYIDAIGDLPASDPPQALGLHPNANITFQASTATEVLETIISIQPKEASAGGGETRESVVAKLVSDMLSKMPADYDPFEVKERLKIMGILNSLNIFLRQELDRMQKVVSLVRKTLKDLLLAIEGTIIMNEALRDALDNIYDARVPNLWKRGSWQSSSMGFWFTELLDRSIQFNTWIYKGRPPQFWMTGFFNPQGFLTAMRQEISRAHKGWSLETVVLYNQVTKFSKEQIRTPPSEGVYVYGLYLEGAGWDRRSDKLTESAMKVLYLLMPVIHLYAINAQIPTGSYVCPVYKRPGRTDLNFITALYLPCKMTPEHWCMRGVALLCDIK